MHRIGWIPGAVASTLEPNKSLLPAAPISNRTLHAKHRFGGILLQHKAAVHPLEV